MTKILELIDIEDLRYKYLVSNTTGYLFRSFYTSESVIRLSDCSMDFLIASINDSYEEKNELEKYLILLSLLFAMGRKNLVDATPFFELCIKNDIIHIQQIFTKFQYMHVNTNIQTTNFIINSNYFNEISNNNTTSDIKPKIITINI